MKKQLTKTVLIESLPKNLCLLIIVYLVFPFLNAWAAPQRIVSLAPSVTEIIYALGAGDLVVGVTSYSDYPPEAKQKPKVGTFLHPSLEAIVNLKPDLVIALSETNPPRVLNRLRDLNIPLLILKSGGLNTIWENIITTGNALGKGKEANFLVARLQKELHALTQQVKGLPKPKVFFQIGYRPLVTCGASAYHHELITLAGGINIAAEEKAAYPVFSLEKVITANPDVIIVSTMEKQTQAIKAFWAKFSQISAVRNNRVYVVNSDFFDRPSPRVVEALKILIKLLHKEPVMGKE
ncbi:MAG: cobalamin-binding protein [Candidatus Desulfofervidaceae bacterium]|nr:cobalamin-binding protein [Candidatus Desulfofervidaceae bacterium]